MSSFFAEMKRRLAGGHRPALRDGTPVPSPDIAAQYEQALNFHRQGGLDEAEIAYRAVLAQAPEHFDAWHMLGIISYQKGQHAAAVNSIDRALAINPHLVAAHFNRAGLLHTLRRLDEALAGYDRAVQLKPDYAEAFSNRGNVLFELKRLEEAFSSYDRAVQLKPDYAEAFNNRGTVLRNLNRPAEALASYERAVQLKPDYAESFYNRGNVLLDLKRSDEALASYDRAVQLKPDYAEALYNRGNLLLDLKRPLEALASYDRVLQLRPDSAEAFNNRGNALLDLKRVDEALASFDRAVQLKPDYAEAFNNRGNTLRELKRFEDALINYDLALASRAIYAEALNNRGVVLQDLQRFDDAIASFGRALTIKHDYADAHNNRGNVLKHLKRLDEALACYDRALAIKPGYVDALSNRGNVLSELKRFDEALNSFDRALTIDPHNLLLFGFKLFCKMSICDWRGQAGEFGRLAEIIASGRRTGEPFPILATSLPAALQRASSEIYIREKHPPSSLLPKFKEKFRHDRIRLGYFSADFHNHATAYLIAGLFEAHDRAQFEVIAFSSGPAKDDAMRERVTKSFDRFFDIGAMSDKEVALLVRSLEIDIAIDLSGLVKGGRTDVFAMRAAPIQVNYLGYPGTMGADYIDYLIADPTVIPKDQQQHYLEKIVYLPNSYQVNDSKRLIADKNFTRADLNLPEDGFVFCCFNNNYKIAPNVFDIWMRLLKAVDGSVLWLFEDNVFAARNLRREAETRGVAAERLVFATRMDQADHLARQRLADLFLDTLPYNAHTTGSDALWAGLPVLTCLGKTFPGKVAASLVKAVGLPELITHSPEEYEALALELATNPQTLMTLREKLAANRWICPLFDTVLFTKHIESAYVSMVKHHQAGLAPEPIYVSLG